MTKKTTKSNCIKILQIATMLYLAYVLFLFALNGRYKPITGSNKVIDTWRSRIYFIDSDELPIYHNGKNLSN